MKKHLTTLLMALAPILTALSQSTALTLDEAKSLYTTTKKNRVSVHDPSVVWDPASQRFYIFGSHRACARTSDLQNWTSFRSPWKTAASNNAANSAAFVTPAVKKIMKGGVETDFPQFNAMEWAARTDASYNIDGNMWAPDVIWNPTMQKWCQYLSINGDQWHSSIILLTADNIEGPYLYQGPVVISGFDNGSHSYKDTDLELVLGTLTTLPSRYNSPWASTSKPSLPNNIDPCVFYDEAGKLWMAYGSWSGGIFMLELDETTGLRDYDVTYTTSGGDPYFGKRIAGGYYVSGEGAYIEHIGEWYYLFMSYGYLSQAGGYEMRVFRSKNPDGPYVDGANRSAVFTRYEMNYGPTATARGEKLMGPYSDWGFMTTGERSQGHNSIIAAPDGRTYLVYHTRFCNADKTNDEGHQVRVHQVFQNKNGWLVAAPFEYNGETTTDADIASNQTFTAQELAGTYSVLVHKFANDYENKEQVTPVQITLRENGTVTGKYSGTWAQTPGTNYINLTLSGSKYEGVVFEETMDNRNTHAVAISAANQTGIGLWAYKLTPKYALAWQLNNQQVPVTQGQTVSRNIDLDALWVGDVNVGLEWTSSHPDIINEHGRYNPAGLQQDSEVTLTARLTCANYYWQQEYTVTALSEENAQPVADWTDGLVAHYGFDDDGLTNTLNSNEQAQLLRRSTTKAPVLAADAPLRNGNYVHLSFGANGKESYVSMPNPLYGRALADGATISFWLRRTDNNLWDALWSAVSGNARLFMTGNRYVGYNDGAGNWLDINNPNTVQTADLKTCKWQLVTITLQPTATSSTGGITVYVDGVAKRSGDKFSGELDGKSISTRTAFDYQRIVDLLADSPQLYLGYGSFWGSPDADFDDVMIYDHALSLQEILALNQMLNRAYDFSHLTGISQQPTAQKTLGPQTIYDLQGRPVGDSRSLHQLPKGLYIINGNKTILK